MNCEVTLHTIGEHIIEERFDSIAEMQTYIVGFVQGQKSPK